MPILNELIAKARAAGSQVLTGPDLFKLYDTYGFPMDLMSEACREQEMTLDEAGFDRAIEEQRNRARKTGGFEQETARPAVAELAGRLGATTFVGYDRLESESLVQAILKGDRLVKEAAEGDEVELVLDVTPFYAEGGGQVGDQGLLMGQDGQVEIKETTRPVPTVILHKGIVTKGRIREGEQLRLTVNATTRQDAQRNHTATHLLHAALRDLLGPHVKQYGSLVGPNRLRFDFAHFRPLSTRDIDEIETVVNNEVRRNEKVTTEVLSIQDAVAKGALAFFGDKYGEQVRVVTVESFSKELCGGTHCRQTGDIGLFRIESETGVAAGVRRIEAQTGRGAFAQMKKLEADIRELSDLLKVGQSELVPKTRKVLTQLKDKERELEELKLKMASGSAVEASARTIAGVAVHVQRTDGLDVNGMRALADQLRDKLKSGVVALGAANDGKVSLLVIVTKDLIAKLKAGDLIKEMAVEVGGTGGAGPRWRRQAGRTRPVWIRRWKRSLGWSNGRWGGRLMEDGKRVLALDYGTVRIGVALSDELGWTAQPLETLTRRTLDRDIAHIAALVATYEVKQVLLGFPLQLDGREGPAIQAMREFQARLEAGVSVPVILWDERLTTKSAEDLLIAADVSRKKRKGVIDRIAASILLQSYLASLEPAPKQRSEGWTDEDDNTETLEPHDEPTDHFRTSTGRNGRSWRRRASDDSLG